MASSGKIVYRDLLPGDSVTAITELLHEAYRPHALRGLHYQAANQDDATTRERLTSGESMVAELKGQIVGTVTLYAPNANAQCPTYRRSGVYKFGQFAVRPDLQRRGIGLKMIELMEKRACERGATHLGLDTAEQATHLIEWYERLGFQRADHIELPNTNYRSVVLLKELKKEARR